MCSNIVPLSTPTELAQMTSLFDASRSTWKGWRETGDRRAIKIDLQQREKRTSWIIVILYSVHGGWLAVQRIVARLQPSNLWHAATPARSRPIVDHEFGQHVRCAFDLLMFTNFFTCATCSLDNVFQLWITLLRWHLRPHLGECLLSPPLSVPFIFLLSRNSWLKPTSIA